MFRIIPCSLILALSLTLQSAGNEPMEGWISDQWGEYIIVPMQNAPFPHPSREHGHTYKEKHYPAEKHYQDTSVALLIPKGYEKRDTVDLVFVFHGWGNNVTLAMKKYELREQLFYCRKNVIMILPQGPKDAPDSTIGKLEDQDGLKRLVREILDFLYRQGKTKTHTLGKVVIAGHSGGYRPVAFCIEKGGLEKNIKEVYLMDAAYSFEDVYASWAARTRGRLISICTNHLLDENYAIMRDLQQKGESRFSLFLDDDATTGNMNQSHVTFIYTKLSHLGLMHKTRYIARFLSTGDLDDIK